tara:strand:- start:92 stop:559 length:468 start_codon:yes stop_codon:yes gene_type:complete
MSFARMQEALRAEGWFVEWNLPCCQSCAWGEVEHTDMTKVLFNHSQDCEVPDMPEEECEYCDGTGFDDEDDVHCRHCEGEGFVYPFFNIDYDRDTSVGGFVCMPPTECDGSMFCFDGTDEGVANFKAIIPLIEASGCEVNWNGSGDTRPDISWEY